MKPTVARVPRCPSLHGWTNRILRVDLSSHRAWVTETAPMVPDYLGARGLAARIV